MNLAIPLFRAIDEDAMRAAALKRILYLDLNMWIEVAERNSDLAARCRDVVTSGKAIFPVSYAAVAEVINQPDGDQRSNIATLMDELSQGISFRWTRDVQRVEIDHVCAQFFGPTQKGIPRELVLCYLYERMGRTFLEFPPAWNQGDAAEFSEMVANSIELRSVRWLVEHISVDEIRRRHERMGRAYEERMTTVIEESENHFGYVPKPERRKRLLVEEQVWVVKRLLSPRMARLLISRLGPRNAEFLLWLTNKLWKDDEHRLRKTMQEMPSLDLKCHIMAERTSNYSRRVRAQDFYDVEHALVAAAYADEFITTDRNLFHVLSRRADPASPCASRVSYGPEGLQKALALVES